MRTVVSLLGVVAAAALVGCPTAQSLVRSALGTTIEQCKNGTSGVGDCTGTAWATGNLNDQNSLYREGDFVPFRSEISGLSASQSYVLRIAYDAVESGLHAYDYLGSFDGSEHSPGQQVVPCYGSEGTAGDHACGSGPSTLAVPRDTNTQFPSGGQADGVLSAWGGTLRGAEYVEPVPIGPGTSGTVERALDVTFTADGDTVVLAWGGHVASSLDWGAGNTFVDAHSGASFHMRLLQINGASTGNRDLSMHGDAIAAVPSPFETQVDAQTVQAGNRVVDTATLSGRAGAPVQGTVTFFICFNAAATPDCSNGGVAVVPGAVVISPSPGSTDGTASNEFVPTVAGHYCFRAEFMPSDSAPYSPGAHTNTTTECFTATPPPPRITITKACSPASDPGLFNLLLDGVALLTNAACGASTGPVTTTAGAHRVSESAGTGTSLGNYSTTIGGNCAADGSITLALGDSATCTITNVRLPAPAATLIVNKLCSPADDPGRFDLYVDSIRFPDVECGGTTGAVTVPPGTHTVRESGGSNTNIDDYTSVIGGACAADGTVTLAAGATATCTVTNTRRPLQPATLRVDKACTPEDDPGRFNLTIDGAIKGSGAGVRCGGTTGAVRVAAGTHTVGETGAGDTDLADYRVLLGGDCAADGTVLVGPGEQATCTITNIRKGLDPPPATLTVNKVCVPEDDGGRFTLKINDESAVDEPCGGRLGPLVVAPGANTVSEAAGTGTKLSDYTTTIGGDCAADGTITVRAGQSATCTITNTRPPEDTASIEVKNDCTPANDPGRFNLAVSDQSFPNMSCGDTTGTVEVPDGDHLVSVTPAPGDVENGAPPQFETTISGDCDANGTVTLQADQHATCVVHHVRQTFKPPPSPPPACYTLALPRRTFPFGVRIFVVARVTIRGRPIRGARLHLTGPGVSTFRVTGVRGLAVFAVRPTRPGLLTVRTRKQYGCPKPPPQHGGVAGATQPSLTG